MNHELRKVKEPTCPGCGKIIKRYPYGSPIEHEGRLWHRNCWAAKKEKKEVTNEG